MIRTLIAFMAGLFPLGAQAVPLAVGAPAPEISAVNEQGQTVKFADVYAKGVTLVYFYPKSGTSGCTAEACSLRDDYTSLHGKGLEIIGVSRDNVDSQKHFQDEYKLPFTLIADKDGKVAEAFGVPMIMKGIIPLASRQSFIVKNGKIAWVSLKAETKGSSAEVQKALDSLK